VKEPVGWKADTEYASRLSANIAFYPAGETPGHTTALIRIAVNAKTDENTLGDLEADMNGYRRETPGIQFEDLAVLHPSYPTFPKLFFLDGSFYEYVTYLNPGKGVPFILSVSMNKQKVRASSEERAAFAEVVRTLRFVSGAQVKEVGSGK
jgi:hypothetical protein